MNAPTFDFGLKRAGLLQPAAVDGAWVLADDVATLEVTDLPPTA